MEDGSPRLQNQLGKQALGITLAGNITPNAWGKRLKPKRCAISSTYVSGYISCSLLRPCSGLPVAFGYQSFTDSLTEECRGESAEMRKASRLSSFIKMC